MYELFKLSSYYHDSLTEIPRKNEDIEEIPENLLLELLQTAVSGANDIDKIKMNAVRAVGNLLQLVKADFVVKKEFVQIIEEGFATLTKNCISGSNMKVSLDISIYKDVMKI